MSFILKLVLKNLSRDANLYDLCVDIVCSLYPPPPPFLTHTHKPHDQIPSPMYNMVYVLQVSEKGDKICSSLRGRKVESFEDKHENEDDGGGCGLSLSLSLHPSTQRSNVSSVSEISETISSYRRHDFSHGFGYSSGKPDLDLSISLCNS